MPTGQSIAGATQLHDYIVAYFSAERKGENMDYYSQFLEEKRKGKYRKCKYPNLIEIHGGLPTDYFAEVTPELMLAVFRGEEDLKVEEICKIAHYNRIPFSVLICPKLILLDMKRQRHKKMVHKLDSLYMKLKCMAKCEGNEEAEKYLKFADWEYQRFARAVHSNKLSYGHYLVIKEKLSNYADWSVPKPKKRGIQQ